MANFRQDASQLPELVEGRKSVLSHFSSPFIHKSLV